MFIILELQSNKDSTAIVTPVKKANRNEALSAYYQALSSAAISSVQKHTVMIVDEEGNTVESKCFYHGVEPVD